MEALLIVGLILKLIYDGIANIIAAAKAEQMNQAYKKFRNEIDKK